MFQLLNRAGLKTVTGVQSRAFSFLAQTTVPKLTSTRAGLSSTQFNSTTLSQQNSYNSNIISTSFNGISPLISSLQIRWSTRGGNLGRTYQPNTLKRKRRLGFLARMRSRTGRNIVKNRKIKGRWFLTY